MARSKASSVQKRGGGVSVGGVVKRAVAAARFRNKVKRMAMYVPIGDGKHDKVYFEKNEEKNHDDVITMPFPCGKKVLAMLRGFAKDEMKKPRFKKMSAKELERQLAPWKNRDLKMKIVAEMKKWARETLVADAERVARELAASGWAKDEVEDVFYNMQSLLLTPEGLRVFAEKKDGKKMEVYFNMVCEPVHAGWYVKFNMEKQVVEVHPVKMDECVEERGGKLFAKDVDEKEAAEHDELEDEECWCGDEGDEQFENGIYIEVTDSEAESDEGEESEDGEDDSEDDEEEEE